MRIRNGGPEGTVRPFTPNLTVMNDVEGQKADALDHIARALSAIDHNLEVLVNSVKRIEKKLG
jgi:hypothetical protein